MKSQTSFDFSTVLDGALPHSWAECSLIDITLLITDGDHNPPKRVSVGIPHLTAKNVKGGKLVLKGCSFVSEQGFQQTSKRYKPTPGDIVMTCVGTLGETAMIPTGVKFSADRNLAALRPNLDLMFGKFLELALHGPACRRIIRKGSGSTAQPHLYLRTIRNLPIRMAPLPEQRRIVAEIETQFSRLDAAVATLKRVQANLARARASVLKAAVEGRLVPTEAELSRAEGRSYEPASVLLERILEERERKHDEAQVGAKRKKKYKPPVEPEVEGLPELPEGWVWASVDQAASQVRYGTSAKCSVDDLGVPVLRMGNIQEGRLVFDKLKYLPSEHDEFPEQHLSDRELLFNRTNSVELVGKTAVFKGYPRAVACASYIIRVVLLSGAHPSFLCFSINSPRGRKWIRSVVSQQVGQANVNGTKLRHHVFPLPPANEQSCIVKEVERRLSVIEALEEAAKRNLLRCERLRQSILKRAFEGKLVPQDPNDEPASELLARIQAQTA